MIWGLIPGGVTALENSKLMGKKIKALARPWQHIYTLLVILISWVFFRSPTFSYALSWLKALLGFGTRVNMVGYSVLPTIGNTTWLAFLVGVLLCFPVLPWIKTVLSADSHYQQAGKIAIHFGYIILLVVCIAVLLTSSYLPTIYGNF